MERECIVRVVTLRTWWLREMELINLDGLVLDGLGRMARIAMVRRGLPVSAAAGEVW